MSTNFETLVTMPINEVGSNSCGDQLNWSKVIHQH